MDLKELGVFGGDQEEHWYYAAKSAALLRCVGDAAPERILDVGAGSGFFARTLLRETGAQSATCLDPAYERDWSETVGDKVIDFCRSITVADADLVLMMDVLEHVDDDRELLQHHVAIAPSHARFVVSVPAFSWLWSAHDTFLEHRRRYTLRHLVSGPPRLRLGADPGLLLLRPRVPGGSCSAAVGKARGRHDGADERPSRSH